MEIMSCRYHALAAAVEWYERTGVPLVAGNDGRFGCLGVDDIGSYYLIPRLVHLFGLDLDAAISVFYVGITVLSFAVGALTSWRYFKTNVGKSISFLGLALLSILIAKIGDVYVALGATPVALVPAWLYIQERGTKPTCLLYCAFAGLIIGVAHFVRIHAGTGVLLFLGVSLLLTKRYSWKQKLTAAITLLTGMLLVFAYFSNLLKQRDTYYLEAVGNTYQPPLKKHPFWHSFYVGFGFLNNDHGIMFDDSYAMRKVASVDPNASFASPEYNAVLKKEILQVVTSDPYFVLKTIFAKLGVLLMYLLIFANIGLILSFLYPKPWPLELAFAVAISFNALFGILVIPSPDYNLGMISFSTIYGILSIDFAVHRGFLRKFQTSRRKVFSIAIFSLGSNKSSNSPRNLR